MGSEGCITTFTEKTWKVTNGAPLIEKCEKVGTLYLCNGNPNFYISLSSTGTNTILWNHRIRHMSEKGM